MAGLFRWFTNGIRSFYGETGDCETDDQASVAQLLQQKSEQIRLRKRLLFGLRLNNVNQDSVSKPMFARSTNCPVASVSIDLGYPKDCTSIALFWTGTETCRCQRHKNGIGRFWAVAYLIDRTAKKPLATRIHCFGEDPKNVKLDPSMMFPGYETQFPTSVDNKTWASDLDAITLETLIKELSGTSTPELYTNGGAKTERTFAHFQYGRATFALKGDDAPNRLFQLLKSIIRQNKMTPEDIGILRCLFDNSPNIGHIMRLVNAVTSLPGTDHVFHENDGRLDAIPHDIQNVHGATPFVVCVVNNTERNPFSA